VSTMDPDTPQAEDTRCGFVAVIGAPNAGKSTLVNQMVGAKVSIVTHKVQTTRTRIRGLAIQGNAQLVFVDTPGIFRPRRTLDRAMVDAAWEGAGDADAVVLLVDAPLYLSPTDGGRSRDDTDRVIARLRKLRRKAILVLNKIDSIKRERLLKLAEELFDEEVFTEVFMISALKGSGVGDLKQALAARMPAGPWLYPEDQAADITERMLAAEITREKLILRLHEELPYSATVETESWQVKDDGSIRIEQTIYVERDGQKAIVLGKGGRTIKVISQAAREELAQMFEVPVHLFLFVKVRETWAEEGARLRAMGLDLPKSS